MKKFSIFLSLSVFIVLTYSTVWPEPQIETNRRYYDIFGDSASKLRREINQKGVLSGGKIYDANTKWYVQWHYTCGRSPAGYSVGDVKTEVTVNYIFPRWADSGKASSDLKTKWDKYVSALTLHEQGHSDFGRLAAIEIESALPAIRSRESRSKCEKEANKKARSILDKYVEKEKKYDRETKNGKDRGAVFP